MALWTPPLFSSTPIKVENPLFGSLRLETEWYHFSKIDLIVWLGELFPDLFEESPDPEKNMMYEFSYSLVEKDQI